MSRGVSIAMTGGLLAIGVPLVLPVPKALIWNASASAPVGLYAVQSGGELHAGDMVAVMPPAKIAAFMDRRGYLPTGLPLIKQVAANSGQGVCRSGNTITIDGQTVAEALTRDSSGRPLPVWSDCQMLGLGELFLLNDTPDSFDGRYFGLTSRNAVIGRVHPIFLPTSNERSNP